MKFSHFAPLDELRQAGGVNVFLLVEGLAQFVGKILVEFALALQALGLVGMEAGQELLVGVKAQVQHRPEKHGGQAQGVEQLDAEAPSRGVQDAQQGRQAKENDAAEQQAVGGPAQVIGDDHISAC